MKNLIKTAKSAYIPQVFLMVAIVFVSILSIGNIYAQNKEKDTVSNEVELQGVENFKYAVDKNTGNVVYLESVNNNKSQNTAEYQNNNITPASIASQFVSEYGGYFGLNNPQEETKLIKEREDDLGMKHYWYNQKYKDIPVFAGQLSVHLEKDLSISSANGIIVPDIDLDVNPTISTERAKSIAIKYFEKQFGTGEIVIIGSELMIFNKGIVENKTNDENYLVYEIELNKEPVRHEYYYINAHDGNLIYQLTGTYNINRRIIDCSNYPFGSGPYGCSLNENIGGHIYGRSEGQPSRGVNPMATYGLTDVDDLYSIMNNTHNYFQTTFSRNGANNNGGLGDDINSAKENSDGWVYLDPVAAFPSSGFDCPNAYFDGFSINFCDGLVYTDVAAHEYGHGVVHYSISGGLTYLNESGALHEAYADIFGAGVENYITGNGNWLMGEDVNVWGMQGPIRSLSNPASVSDGLGSHPNRFYSNNMYCGTEDNGGVHHNSTVVSHAAYLMAEGGSNNSCTITAIGRDKMEQIFYRALTNYFTTNTDFNGAYNALNAACADLYGASSSTCVAASQALMSVEINQGGKCSTEARVAPGCSDTISPEITNKNPVAGAGDIARNTNVSFEINDNNAGVNFDSLYVVINNKDVIKNSASQSGYSVSIKVNSNNGYDISINPDSNFDYNKKITVEVEVSDNNNNSTSESWSFTTVNLPLDPKIITTSGPGEVTRMQAYTRQGNPVGSEIKDIFPESYLGGAGVVPIDANNNGLRDQMAVFATDNGGPQVRVLGLKGNGEMSYLGQMFVFDSSIRDGLSMVSGDFDNDGFDDDVAACLTGDREPNIKIYKDAVGIDNWEKIGDFTAAFYNKNVGCNIGTFQYDNGADEILVAPNHGPEDPIVYIYKVDGTLKEYFAAYGQGVQSGLTPSGIEDRIYTTPNNGSSQINVFDKYGQRKNFWWAYAEHVRGDFKNVPGDIDLDGKDEILISPIGSNGPQVLAFEPTGKWRSWPNFFAFGDESLRNGVGIAVIDNFHGAN